MTESDRISFTSNEPSDLEAWETFSADWAADDPGLRLYCIDKVSETKKFRRALGFYRELFHNAKDILEIGGGSLWASYLVKKLFPQAKVVGSDYAPHAVSLHHVWQEFFNTQLDQLVVCMSHELPFDRASFDLAFTFESAHHFSRHRQTFNELARVVKPGGHVLYLFEPSCSPLLYPLAYRRVMSFGITEDILIHNRIVELAKQAEFEATILFDPHLINREPRELFYYIMLQWLPLLQPILPCTAHYVFRRR